MAEDRFSNILVAWAYSGTMSFDNLLTACSSKLKPVTGLVCFLDYKRSERRVFLLESGWCPDWEYCIMELPSACIRKDAAGADFSLTVWRGKELPEREFLRDMVFSPFEVNRFTMLQTLKCLQQIAESVEQEHRREAVGLKERYASLFRKEVCHLLSDAWESLRAEGDELLTARQRWAAKWWGGN